ncbi:hypothetical protein [Roseicyclus marinus]|uniref:hypothetical protein n=1 Tax=Roseicyclus marinus TaxID=2161673 RepID=UPI00240F5024|nr:hypothetical protein [Roseicyclus marinus]MDG3042477.1 hypothetical protein [Roseicyclus marinus]
MAKPNVSARAARRNEQRKTAHPITTKFIDLLRWLHLALAIEQHLMTCPGSSPRTVKVIAAAESSWNKLDIDGRRFLAETAPFASHWPLREACKLMLAAYLLRDHERAPILFSKILRRLVILRFMPGINAGMRPPLAIANELMAQACVLEKLSAACPMPEAASAASSKSPSPDIRV